MKTTLIPGINLLGFAGIYWSCGSTFVLQLQKSSTLAPILDRWNSLGETALQSSLALLLSFVIFHGVIQLSLKVHKRKIFLKRHPSVSAWPSFWIWCARLALIFGAGLSAALSMKVSAIQAWVDHTALAFHTKLLEQPWGLESLLSSQSGRICYSLGLLLTAVMLLWIAQGIYLWLRSSKHAPIFKSYHIHGKLNSILELLWTSAKVKGFGVGLKGEDVVGVPADTVFTERISSKDWLGEKNDQFTMAFRESFMPHAMQMNFEMGHLHSIYEHLTSYLNGSPLSKKNLIDTVKKSHLFEALQNKALQNCPSGLNRESLSHLILTMLEQKEDQIKQPDEKLLKRLNRGSRLYDFGGMFICQLFEEVNGSLTPTTKLRENLQKTLDLTTSKDGIGEHYLEKGDLLIALTYNHFAQNDEVSDEDMADGEEFGNERNTIYEYKKTWYNTLWDGWGRAYMFYHGGVKYIYDEWWLGSHKWFNNPFSNGPKERALRRVGYIRKAGGKTVAKIEDTQVILKLLGSYNRKVSIYDEELSKDNNFGTLLCLFSQYLTHQQSYRWLRLQNSLPMSVGYNGGDMDASAQ